VILIFKLKEKRGVKYYIIEEFLETGLVEHAFTTKVGGVSKGEYKSLNLGLHVDDNKEDVLENRRRICEILNSDYYNLVAGEQLHNDLIKVVSRDDQGRGAVNYKAAISNTDALITNQKGVLLTSSYADCTPILLLDPVQEVVGLAHAGWRGTVKKIVQKTILKMKEVYGTKSSDLLVGLGPAIGECCYQVDGKVIKKLANYFNNWENFVTEDGYNRWKLNLAKVNQAQLQEIGVGVENITDSGFCTSCQEQLFFSYRRDNGKTGRMASLIKLK